MPSAARLLRALFWTGGAALIAFHGWLLASQAAAGRLAEPGVALRWLLAAALVATLMALRQSRHSMWGRNGVAIWVLAALLHGPAVASANDNNPDAVPFPDVIVAVVVQISTTVGSLALVIWLLGWLLGGDSHRWVRELASVESAVDRRLHRNRRPFAPRPPPRF
jgi:hypothetical protein